MTYFAELSPCGEEIVLHKDNAIIGSFRPEMKAEADAIVRSLNACEPTAHPILHPMPFLFAAFDFEREDGSTHWCIRYKLPIGESGPDHDSEVLCEVFEGFAWDYSKVDEGADEFPYIEAVSERLAVAFNAHDALVKIAERVSRWESNPDRYSGDLADIGQDARIALKLAKDPR